MEIVIKISDTIYNNIIDIPESSMFSIDCDSRIRRSIQNGTPLPKGHGRLIDMDELVKRIVEEYGVNSIYELPQNIKAFYEKFIASTPTVLDATLDYKLKNYAFVECTIQSR